MNHNSVNVTESEATMLLLPESVPSLQIFLCMFQMYNYFTKCSNISRRILL